MRPAKGIYMLLVLLLIAVASGAPDETSGRVVLVIDGDTFDMLILEHDGRIQEDTIRVRLADLDAPELYGERACEEGEWARDYTHSWLMDSIVNLDLDDMSGQDEYGRWIAVCYLEDGRNFNKMLVDSGNSALKDFRSNEFDPYTWRDIEIEDEVLSKIPQEGDLDYDLEADLETDMNTASEAISENGPPSHPETISKIKEKVPDSGLWKLLAELLEFILRPELAS